MKGKGKVSADKPKVISEYNKGMGVVDLLDMLLGSYRPNLRSKKWWWPLFVNTLNIAVVAAFKIPKKYVFGSSKSAIRRSNCFSPTTNKIKWSQSHLGTNISGSLYPLQKNTRLKCSKCDKRLHKKVCHELYHSK